MSTHVPVRRYMWCDIHEDQTTGGPLADEQYVLASAFDALAKERDSLRAALKKYGQHKCACGYSDDGEYTWGCTCGLDSAMKEQL